MRTLIEQIKTSYGHLSDRLIEEYDRRQYMRFYKGKLEGQEAKVSLATACFYIGQGFGYIRGLLSVISSRIGHLRTVRRNRLK
jgi:hypothetical protein